VEGVCTQEQLRDIIGVEGVELSDFFHRRHQSIFHCRFGIDPLAYCSLMRLRQGFPQLRGGLNRDLRRAGQKTLTIFRNRATVDLILVQYRMQHATSINRGEKSEDHRCGEPHRRMELKNNN
jgi:hypothetical protein